VMYGSGELLPNPASITQNMPSASSDFKVSNRYGFQEGDIVIAAEAGKDCTLSQVSNLPGAPNPTDQVVHNPGNYTDPNTGAQKDVRYNPSAMPPGSGIPYTTNAKLFNIGSLPANNIYSVQNSQLTLQQALFGAVPAGTTPLYDGIAQLQVQYGRDTDLDGDIDVWSDALPTIPPTNAEWRQVIAIRLAVVARSGLREKPDPDGVCRITTAAPTWIGGAITLAADPDWQCYRYKVFQTAVPLRNMIWKP